MDEMYFKKKKTMRRHVIRLKLDKLEKDLKDEIAQAQKDTVSQITAMLGFKDQERGKAVEAVNVLSPQSKMICETFSPKEKFQIYMAGTSTHIPAGSGMKHGKNRDSEVLHRVSMNKKLEERFAKLEDIIRAIQGGNIYGGIDARDLSLVTDLVTPPKFKIPEFEKYDGTMPLDALDHVLPKNDTILGK
ncbi:hypothetical protein GQ457_17G012380 [Hibiscus cannabinus]